MSQVKGTLPTSPPLCWTSGLRSWTPLTAPRFSVTLDAAWIRWWDAGERTCGREGRKENDGMRGEKSINPFIGSWRWSRNHILSRDKDPHCWYEVKSERRRSRRLSKDYVHPSWKSSELNRPKVITVRPLKAEGGERQPGCYAMTPLFYHRAAVVIGILHSPYLLGPLPRTPRGWAS